MTLKTITQEKLKVVLDLHEKYLNGDPNGIKADLTNANLRGANLRDVNLNDADLSYAILRYADLSGADLTNANLRGANLRDVNLNDADLSYAILRYADLSGADLTNANLRGANLRDVNLNDADLDFSLFPLWCGSFGIKCDMRLFAQLAYHMCRLDVNNCEDSEELKHYQELLKPIANKFHRVEECGLIE